MCRKSNLNAMLFLLDVGRSRVVQPNLRLSTNSWLCRLSGTLRAQITTYTQPMHSDKIYQIFIRKFDYPWRSSIGSDRIEQLGGIVERFMRTDQHQLIVDD